MAELLIWPLISMVKDKASSYLLDQYMVMEGMEEQRQILERKLPAILDIIQDAEEKGAFRPGVRAFLRDLKTAAYEANDIFDEFKYEALRREAMKKGQYSKLSMNALRLFPTHNPIAFLRRMGDKLRRIVQTIEVLVAEMNAFGFRHLQQAPPSKDWRKTDHILVDSEKDIVSRSRDEEKKKILRILLDEASDKDLTVLPIVGMGGLGKTTFVQLIYNEPEVEKHFELRRWCCVSDDFDTATIASNICQTNINNENGREKALQDFQSLISGKRYLIVLDDVWNKDYDKWEKLKTCLKHGGKGSVVLTTTRIPEIAQKMIMGVDEAHNIENLHPKYLKEIFEGRAFSLLKPNSDELDAIVDKIVGKCAGSPLAAKAFGSMLSTKTSIKEWEDILAKSNICSERTGILPILKLSFDDLPPHMKQCFAFCALFPKDYEIDKELLIELWMAHDLIPVEEEDHLEAVGEEIFKELTWRSFFQDVKQKSRKLYGPERFQFRNSTICKIHDLMHDIALSVLGKECVTIVDESSMKKLLPTPTRHFFLSSNVSLMVDFWKKQSPTLRTVFLCEYNGAALRDMSNYTSLRALHLPKQRIKEVGAWHLQHLRYLNLSGNSSLKQLPESISMMYNLQTLDLSHCNNLRQLPKDMKYMASLQHLYTNRCLSLRCMPLGLGQITSLQTLTHFIVSASFRCSTIGELQNLNLGGELELSCLQNATEAHAKAASLEKKEKLTHLSLKWNSEGQEELVQDCHKKVLYALKPPDGLEMLRIVNYKGTSFPSWITDHGVLQHLTKLHLLGCLLCEEFPQFCHFKALQVLYLEKLDKLRSLCSDVPSTPFPELKELQLHDLEGLERWVAVEGKELNFPVLEKVNIKNCPKLTSLPEAPKLKDIKLNEDKALLSLAIVKSGYMSLLSKLVLSTRFTEATLPQIDGNHESSLSELNLMGRHVFFSSSPSQPTFGAWKWFGKLVSLNIYNCDVLIYWPEEVFKSLVSLKNLEIKFCSKLIGPTEVKGGEPPQTTGQVLPHLNSIVISFCESLAELFILPPSLKNITILVCPKLKSIWGKEEQPETCTSLEYRRDLASTSMLEQSPSPTNCCPCLESLYISSCGSLVTLPNLPPSLRSLYIRYCEAFCSMSGQLDALEILDIYACTNVETLPSLPPSLRLLDISSCEVLCSVSGHLDALESLCIYNCKKLQSLDSLGDLPSLETLYLARCRCLASLPGHTGSYSALRKLTINCCPAIDLKPLYKRHQQRLDSLEDKRISHAHSSDPYEGPKLREPRSWKYAIPWCQNRAEERLRMSKRMEAAHDLRACQNKFQAAQMEKLQQQF